MIIEYTRPAKCKDCINCRYYYIGKLKRHKCVIKDKDVRLNDTCGKCIDDKSFELNLGYYPKPL